ncbi:MAG: hypothetical protein AAFX81_00405 [Pseudomonadota bacterium]
MINSVFVLWIVAASFVSFVSFADDLKSRFAQRKEVLLALVCVLGTIVGL